MKAILIISSLLLYLSLTAQKINPAHPDLSPGNFRMDSLPNSEINIPIQVNLKPFFLEAEKSVDTVFTSPNYPDGWLQEGCDIRFKYVFRRSPFRISGSLNTLSLGFTGYYKIVGSTRVCLKGTVISPWTPPCKCGFGKDGERKVNVSFLSSIGIDPDYKIRLYTKRNDPKALDKCEVCFWGQDITKQVMKGLTTELDAAKKDIDKNYGITDIKSKMQQLWDQLNNNYNLYGLGWLQINPTLFRVNRFFIENDSLNVFFGLSARPVISFEKPADKNSWVPNLGPHHTQSGFSIFLDAVLNYDSLSILLNEKLVGKEFNFKKGFVKKKFIIDSCRIYGGGFEKLIIRVNFSGTNNGIFYLVGKPVYNEENKIIEVKDIDFDIKSKNFLLGSADWLFDRKITREISKQARFNLSNYIDTAKISINAQLNRELIKGIRSSGVIKEIRLAGIYPMQQHLVIRSNCEGKMAIKAESIIFSL